MVEECKSIAGNAQAEKEIIERSKCIFERDYLILYVFFIVFSKFAVDMMFSFSFRNRTRKSTSRHQNVLSQPL